MPHPARSATFIFSRQRGRRHVFTPPPAGRAFRRAGRRRVAITNRQDRRRRRIANFALRPAAVRSKRSRQPARLEFRSAWEIPLAAAGDLRRALARYWAGAIDQAAGPDTLNRARACRRLGVHPGRRNPGPDPAAGRCPWVKYCRNSTRVDAQFSELVANTKTKNPDDVVRPYCSKYRT